MSIDTQNNEFKNKSEQGEKCSQELEKRASEINSSLVGMLGEGNTNSDLNRTLIHNHIKKIKEYTHQRLYKKSSNFKKVVKQLTSPEEYEKFESLYKEVNEHLKTIIKRGSPYIRVKSENLFSILSEGFKTLFETNTSGGAMNPDQRNKIEKILFGYESQKTDPICRPRYGYWYDGNPLNCAEGYGDIVCKLNPSTIENTTIVGCDSLRLNDLFSLPCASFYDEDSVFFVFFDSTSGGYFDLLEEIASNPSMYALSLSQEAFLGVMRIMQYLKSVKNIDNWLEVQRMGYMEFQHHGPLFAEDIESLHIPQNIQLDQKILNLCKQKGIAIIRQ